MVLAAQLSEVIVLIFYDDIRGWKDREAGWINARLLSRSGDFLKLYSPSHPAQYQFCWEEYWKLFVIVYKDGISVKQF